MPKSKVLKLTASLLLMGAMTLQSVAAAPPVYAAPAEEAPSDVVRYQQDMGAAENTIKGAETVPVNGAAMWGMDGKALRIQTQGDQRVKLIDFDAIKDGSYEFTARTEDNTPGNASFLVRYENESSYLGISADFDTHGLKYHYSKPNNGRENKPISSKFGDLEPNTSYLFKIAYEGDNLTLAYQKEGEKQFTEIKQAAMAGHSANTPGGFAVRVNQGSRPGNAILLDNIVQKDADGKILKTLDFNDGKVPNYESRANKANALSNNKASLTVQDLPVSEQVQGLYEGKVSKLTKPGVYQDTSAPVSSKFDYTVKLSSSGNQYGLVFNYKDSDNYASIEFDGSKWIAGGKKAGQTVAIDLSAHNIAAAQAGTAHTYELNNMTEKGYVFSIDGVKYELGNLDGICTEEGQVGLIVGNDCTVYAEPIQVDATLTAPILPEPTENVITLKSDKLQAVVSSEFPTVYTYKSADGTKQLAYGEIADQANTGVYVYTALNSERTLDESSKVQCTATSKLVSSTEDSACYTIHAVGTDVDVELDATLVLEGNTLKLEITDVRPAADSKPVRAFGLNSKMLTMAGSTAGAAASIINGWGPAADKFLDNRNPQNRTLSSLTYALLYDNVRGSVAAVENNASSSEDKYFLEQQAGQLPTLSLRTTAWAWNYFDNTDPKQQPNPYITVVIGGDENNDGEITWQDAGVAYRTIMHKAFGSENVKNEWMYIAMNMSSQASQPFLRVLDNAKAFSYLTDGFGMKIMNKGYQASGHDDSHGDYAFVGEQQGDIKDFNYLIDEGLKYGIKNGVHINMTEFSLDSRAATKNNMIGLNGNGDNLRPNWTWCDQAYLVDKGADVDSGELKARLDAFEKAVPNLDFAYVDVYQSGSDYRAIQAAKYMNSNGLTIGTEALGDFNQDITFVHWNTDMYYAVGGTQSQVMRFITNGVGDLSAPDRALMGALMPGVADWRNTNNFFSMEKAFYRENLPTKYLQYFDLLKWVPDQYAEFSNQVKSVVTNEGGRYYTTITKDGMPIAKLDTTSLLGFDTYAKKGSPRAADSAEIFIPWSPVVEDKIYCYSDKGGQQTWQLPNSWRGVETAYLYELTNSGRTAMQEIPVSDGSVSFDLTAGHPYILVKTPAAQSHLYTADGQPGALIPLPEGENAWGQGSAVKNFGFSSGTLEGWETSTGVSVDTTFSGNSNEVTDRGDPRAKLDAAHDASISQQMTVTPGATYTVSAWVNSESARPVTLTVNAGTAMESTTLDTTKGLKIQMKPSKYLGKDYQRIRVTVTIPQDVSTAELTLSAPAGELPVYVDDVRAWQWPNGASPSSRAEKYYYYEDFENVDEGWGPFISTQGSQPTSHLVYKLEDGSQLKYYTADTLNEDGTPDTENRVSLHIRGANGTRMRTTPATLNFKQGNRYKVEFDYQTYREINGKEKTPQLDLSGNPIPAKYNGCNYPLPQSSYTLTVHHADGSVINSYALKASTFKEGDKIENFALNSRPSTELMCIEVDATNENGIYLTVDAGANDGTGLAILDNFRVTEIGSEDKAADKTALNAMIDAAAEKQQADYTEETWNAFTKALEAAKTVRDNEAATQDEVDTALNNLTAAMEALAENIPAVDKAALNAMIDAAAEKQQADYTEETWNAFSQALEAAKTVSANEAATQDEVNTALNNLTAAMEALAENVPAVDKTALNAMIDAAAEKQQADYTEETWNAFSQALEAAKTVRDNEVATQDEVNTALDNLTAAMKALAENVPAVDKAALNAMIDAAAKKQQADYTEETWNAFSQALEAAKTVSTNEAATQNEVNTALDNLTAAMNSLVNKAPAADKTALNSMIAAAAGKQQADYTEETWNAFAQALEAATTVNANEAATQNEVNTALHNLTVAMNGLIKKAPAADKTALNSMITAAAKKQQADYTEETWNAFSQALEAAKAVNANKAATQKEVNTALSNLVNAMSALEKAPIPTEDPIPAEKPVPTEAPESTTEPGHTGKPITVVESVQNAASAPAKKPGSKPATDPNAKDKDAVYIPIFSDLTEVPATLEKLDTVNTVEKITDKLFEASSTKDNAAVRDNFVVMNVELILKTGDHEVKVTHKDFPKDGVVIELPYPKGTNGDDFTFVVTHMFTNGRAGEVETLPYSTTENGLRVTIKGLSPIGISWTEKSEVATNSTTEPVETPTVAEMEKTENGSSLWIWLAILAAFLALAVVFVIIARKKAKKD